MPAKIKYSIILYSYLFLGAARDRWQIELGIHSTEIGMQRRNGDDYEISNKIGF